MKKNLIYFISKFNNSVYKIFSSFPSYVGKFSIGLIYGIIFYSIFSFFGKRFFKTFFLILIIIFILNWLNFINFNFSVIRSTIGFSGKENIISLIKNFFENYFIEFLSFIFSFFILKSFLN